MTNYRPISLFTTFSNLYEKALHSKLSHYQHTNNILVTGQRSVRKGISTDNTAFKQMVYLNLLTRKCMLEEFSVL